MLGAMLTGATIAIFAYNSENQLIRASCREASFVLLFGILANFLSLLVFIGQPTPAMCYAQRFSFHLLNTFIYAPILIKIIKIYRIFSAGVRSTQAPKWISPKTQVAAIGGLLLIEVSIVACSIVVLEPNCIRVMPVRTEPFVEITCNEDVASVLMGLALNMLLVASCAVYAFKARRMPQHFNESSQIAFCVYTSIVLWLVYIPAFLLARGSATRTLLQTLSMVLQSLLSLSCLFFPKVYVVYFVTRTQTGPVGPRQNNRVGITNSTPAT